MVSKNKLFISFSLFLLSGIFIYNLSYSSIFWGIKISLWILFLLFIIFLSYYVYKRKYWAFMFITCIWFLIWASIAYVNIETILSKEKLLAPYLDNSKQSIALEIIDVYKIKDYSNEYIAEIKELSETAIHKKIKLIVVIPSNFTIKKWYVITWSSKLFSLQNSPWFSYKSYMLSKNIFFKTYLNYYEISSIKNPNIAEKYIWKIRKKVLRVIESLYPKEEWIFLGWILIWARENLPSELKADFNNSWLTHFIAVSGFNITILVVFLTYILKYLPVPIRVVTITLSIGLFTILVWDTAPVVRASIMGLIWYYILVSGRQWNGLSIMLLTATIMVIISPLALNYDVSLHLSFLAVLWIMYTQGFFMKIFSFLPELLEIKTAFVLTLASLAFTLPIMIFNFGQVSIMAPFANIAVAWTIPLAMLLGFLSIIVYFVYPIFWLIVWYFTWIFLKWDILVVHFFWKLDWAILEIDLWIYKNHAQILYFAILIFLILWFRKKEETI